MSNPQERSEFLNFAGLIEGGLALAALGIGWCVSINPLEHLAWDWRAFVWGVLATVPTFALFWMTYRFPVGSLRRIRDFLTRELAPSLANLHWYDLILLSILAGVAEELLFRGLLQPWIARACDSAGAGQFVSNLIFGVVHWVTPLYALLACGIGNYLSWLMTLTQPPNLLTPMVTHTLHDYLAFLVIVAEYRRREGTPPQE
ncbi:MAG: lysostaphin resistance A-like protein [Planctomycetaceae bacterium]